MKLAESHYDEVDLRAGKVPLNINPAMIATMLEHKMLTLMVAKVEYKVVGYLAFMVVEDFTTSTLCSKEVGMYIMEDYRGGSLFYRMFKLAELELDKLGVVTKVIAFKDGHDTGMAERLGYTKSETVYEKTKD